MMLLVFLLLFIISSILVDCIAAETSTASKLNIYLQSELAATSAAQNRIVAFLKQNDIPIGLSILNFHPADHQNLATVLA